MGKTFLATKTITALVRFSVNMAIAVPIGIPSSDTAVSAAYSSAENHLVSDPFGVAGVDS